MSASVLKNSDGEWRAFEGGLVRGDFGPSLKYRNHSVNDIIAQGLPVSLSLGLLSFCFALGIGIPLGVWTAIRRGRWQDHVGSFFSILAVCIPAFVLGPVLIVLLGIRWPVFPVGLWGGPWHVILPAVTLGTYFAGKVSRLAREGMSQALQSDFITTARAKGVSETAIVLRHALREGLLPVVTYSGPLLADLLVGSFVVENLFQIPGIGVFLVNSSINRDYTMVVGLVILYSVMLLTLNSGGRCRLRLAGQAGEIWLRQRINPAKRLAKRRKPASRRTAAPGCGSATTVRRWWRRCFCLACSCWRWLGR